MITFTILLTLCMAVVIFFDATRYIIPNWLNAIILLMYPIFVWLSPIPVVWMDGVYALAVMFGIGLLMFILKIMGGGDIKLLFALSPWCGLGRPLLDLMVFIALYGGALTLFLLFTRPFITGFFKAALKKSPPRMLKVREPVPYGLAIAAGVVTMMWMGRLPMLPSLGAFVHKLMS
jgi:prepilin peptidase CpaA